MAFSSETWTRWQLRCDGCGAEAWTGARADGSADAWCEGCQRGAAPGGLARPGAACAHCAAPLTAGAPRFVELPGALQNLIAVLAAWDCDPVRLSTILPERPRFLGDLDPPPAHEEDPEVLVHALERLERGRLHAAAGTLRALAVPGALEPHRRPRTLHALAIAETRLGGLGVAESAWDAAIELEESAVARLNRGTLRARRDAFNEAFVDFALAGDSREARWNRAALAIVRAVAATPALPEVATIAAARKEAGEVSSYWSDHTIGRLLWSLLLERELVRTGDDVAHSPDVRVLRAAEAQFEHDTFWDRAMILHGYAALDMTNDASRVAAPLAEDGLARLLAEPFAYPQESEFRAPLERARAAARAGRAAEARATLEALLRRGDVSRYRLACVTCERGAWGVESVEERETVG